MSTGGDFSDGVLGIFAPALTLIRCNATARGNWLITRLAKEQANGFVNGVWWQSSI
jgi:hypothetical protein